MSEPFQLTYPCRANRTFEIAVVGPFHLHVQRPIVRLKTAVEKVKTGKQKVPPHGPTHLADLKGHQIKAKIVPAKRQNIPQYIRSPVEIINPVLFLHYGEFNRAIGLLKFL